MVDCVFCGIVKKEVRAYILHEDELCISFLDLRQVRPGHAMVIPKKHVNHFIDLEDDVARHIVSVAGRVARKIREKLAPPRVGYVVAGFGVPHAHFHVQPMWEEHDITSQRYLDASKNPPAFSMDAVPVTSEEESQRILSLIRL